MNDKAYTALPQADLTGGAGSGGPTYRETRYKTYTPRLRQRHREEKA